MTMHNSRDGERHDPNRGTSGINPDELSDIWRELLGSRLAEIQANTDATYTIPPVASDPWGELLNTKGIEVVDLHKVYELAQRIALSEIDMEQALHIMQEENTDSTNK